jgi:hypothetical protein
LNKSVKSTVIMLFLLNFSIIVIGCNAKYGNVYNTYTEEIIINQTGTFEEIPFQDNKIFNVHVFPLPIHEHGELTDITGYGNNIYYIVQFLKWQSNVAEVSRVYEYNVITDKHKLIYELEDPKVYWVNELRAGKGKLFWIILEENKYTLESFDIKTQKVEKIHSVISHKVDQPIVLGGNHRYFSWYEFNDETNSYNIAYYNLENKEITHIDEVGVFFDIYDRPSIAERQALVLVEKNDKTSFNLVNLKNLRKERIFDLSKDIHCFWPQVSKDYIVWRDRYAIYYYSFRHNHVSKICFNELGINIFSMHLYDNFLYINAIEDILYFNLEEMNYSIITDVSFYKEAFCCPNYILAKISLDKQYICVLNKYPEYYVTIINPRQ